MSEQGPMRGSPNGWVPPAVVFLVMAAQLMLVSGAETDVPVH